MTTLPLDPDRSVATLRPLLGAPARRLRRTLVVVVAVLLLAELAVRIAEPALPPPPVWPTDEWSLKQDRLQDLAHHGGVSTLIVGSSVSDVSIDPAQLSAAAAGPRGAYNASLIAATPYTATWFAMHVAVPLVHPDTVVLAISSRDVNKNGARLESSKGDLLQTPGAKEVLGKEDFNERLAREVGDVSALFRYRAVLRRPLQALAGYDPPDRNISKITDAGLETHLLDEPYRGGPDVEQFFRDQPLLRFQLSEQELGALGETAVALSQQGIRVVILDVPVTQQYIDLHPYGLADYNQYHLTVSGLAHQAGVEYIYAGVWDRSLFADPLHLNRQGAAQLTALLDQRLQAHG